MGIIIPLGIKTTKIYQPENGDLVLFPSSLFHETIPVTQEVERCVIAFDLAKVIEFILQT